MKVTLTGSTGFIGGEVLKQCLADPQIDSLIILSRRKLHNLDGNFKAKVVLLEDFTRYPEDVTRQLDGSDACIWSLGTFEGNREVEIDYPRALFDAITSTPSYASRTKPFRHVHLSGAVAEPDQNKTLWYYNEGRKAKGVAQSKVIEYSNDAKAQGRWSTYIVRPGYVFPATADCSWYHSILSLLMTPYYSVRSDELAVTMVNMAVNGGSQPMLESKQIGQIGRKLLTKSTS